MCGAFLCCTVVHLTLCECQDISHLPVLAQQKTQLLDSSILFSAHKHFAFFSNQGNESFCKTEWRLKKRFIRAVMFHLPSHHLKLTKTPSPPSTSGIPGLTKKKNEGFKCYFWLTVTSCLVNLRHDWAHDVMLGDRYDSHANMDKQAKQIDADSAITWDKPCSFS